MNKWTKAVLATAITASSLSVSASPVELDSMITIVNDTTILASDIEALKKTVLLNTDITSLPPQEILEKQILDQLIIEELQIQEAKRLGIRIDDTRLEQAISAIATDKKISLSTLKKQLQLTGISWADYREQIRKEITISEARNAQVRRRINILPQEIDALVAQLNTENKDLIQYRLRHIQLALTENADKTERDVVMKDAKIIIKKLNNGEDAATLALAYSKGPKALNGGDWGWMRKEEMPTVFADQIKNNEKGSIIGPFRSGVGYHILKIDDIKGIESVPIIEVNARHILIKTSIVLSDEGAKHQLNTLIEQINSGEKSFAELAKQHSADPGSAANGGELGWQTSDLYVSEFKNKVDTLSKGTVSSPFKTAHGWHIVEVLERRQTDGTDTAMKNRAYNMLLSRKFNEEAQAWLKELHAGAYIEQINGVDVDLEK